MHEEIDTWSTLSTESYLPTDRKPWQGIWVGDYSAHGCEFLLVIHKDAKELGRQQRVIRRSSTMSGLPSGVVFANEDMSEDCDKLAQTIVNTEAMSDKKTQTDELTTTELSGRLEAIKLTGDVNVPRGQCTWFADDISDASLIRIGDGKHIS